MASICVLICVLINDVIIVFINPSSYMRGVNSKRVLNYGTDTAPYMLNERRAMESK